MGYWLLVAAGIVVGSAALARKAGSARREGDGQGGWEVAVPSLYQGWIPVTMPLATRAEAIAMARELLGADAEGKVELVAESSGRFAIFYPDQDGDWERQASKSTLAEAVDWLRYRLGEGEVDDQGRVHVARRSGS